MRLWLHVQVLVSHALASCRRPHPVSPFLHSLPRAPCPARRSLLMYGDNPLKSSGRALEPLSAGLAAGTSTTHHMPLVRMDRGTMRCTQWHTAAPRLCVCARVCTCCLKVWHSALSHAPLLASMLSTAPHLFWFGCCRTAAAKTHACLQRLNPFESFSQKLSLRAPIWSPRNPYPLRLPLPPPPQTPTPYPLPPTRIPSPTDCASSPGWTPWRR